jgi:hypothetical protein
MSEAERSRALRDRLAESIARRAVAQQALEAAIAAQRRGEEFEREAEADYARFGDVDAKIIDARSRRISTWAQSGNGALPPEWFDIDGELTAARRLRDEARERLVAATDAVIELRRGANAAQSLFTEAKERAAWLAGQILAAIADARADRLAELKRETWRAEDELHALASLWVAGSALDVKPSVPEALEMDRPRWDADRAPGMPFQREHFAALWAEFAARLVDDAEAEFEWRPPRPEDRKTVNPFITRAAVPPFKPNSLVAAERDEAARQQAAAEPLHPFAASTARTVMTLRDGQLGALGAEHQTAAQKHRAEREAMERLVEQAEGE